MILFEGANMSLRYDGHSSAVFSNLSLTIRKGDGWYLTGPSGAGKTSLLRVIAGLETAAAAKLQRNFLRPGFAFAEPRLLARLTVAQNLELVGVRTASIGKLLGQLDLHGIENRLAGALSKGQAQRVALLRALSIRPDILLLDEALGGLDTARWELARDLVRRAHEQTGAAVIEVTHDPARRILTDRSLFLGLAPQGRDT